MKSYQNQSVCTHKNGVQIDVCALTTAHCVCGRQPRVIYTLRFSRVVQIRTLCVNVEYELISAH